MQNGFVPFAEVKRAVSLQTVLERYQLLEGLTRKGANLVGPCPFCKAKSARQFQVNLVKNAWYCFACKQGGNVLDFVSKRERVGVRTAALKLDSWFELGLVEESPRPDPPPAPAETQAAADEDRPIGNPPLTFILKTLDPTHESLAALELGSATTEHFGAGYCSKGLLKGRVAIPIHNRQGDLVAYAGLAIQDDEVPRYLFPPKFHPALEVFNLHRLIEVAEEQGPLYLTPEIGGVLRLFEAGLSSVLGLFDGSLSYQQEEAVADALLSYEGFVLVGEGFADRTVARLARYATVSWVPDVPYGLSPKDREEEEV